MLLQNFFTEYYLIIKAFHLIFVISWMAGLLYLPRLFVYHTRAKKNSELDLTLKIMEEKLMKIIINPAMLLSLLFGLILILINGFGSMGGWLHAKLFLLILLLGFHGACSKWRKNFYKNINTKSEKFYRIVNEVPALLMAFIVLLAVVKPF